MDRLGGGAVSPERSYENPVGPSRDKTLANKQPESTNPSARDLPFTPAAENRDVAARLAQLQTEMSPNVRPMRLEDCLRQAQQTAREHISAEEDYLIASIQLLIQRHAFELQPTGVISTGFNEVNTSGARELTQTLLGQFGVTKQLESGGQLSAAWVWNATENLRSEATGRYVQSSSLVLSGNIPLLRGAGDAAQETLIQAERNLVYAARNFENFRRQFLVSVSIDYFNLLLQQDGIESQVRQLEGLENLERRQRAWYEAGRIREFDVNLATNNVLQARATLANLREAYILTLDQFKIRLGLPVREAIRVVNAEFMLPEPETTLEAATEAALNYRLDLQNQRDSVVDAKRQIDVAYNQLLPDLNLTGSVTFPTKAGVREGGAVYEFDDAQYAAGMTFALPLDRQVQRLQLRQQTISYVQAKRAYEKFRDGVILDVRGKTREIDRARLALQLAEERVKINLRRQEEQDLKPDEVTTREKVDTSNDLLDSERSRNQARADLRIAVLNFLQATGEMRVKREGTFEPLPGMGIADNQQRAPAAAPPASSPAVPAEPATAIR